MAVLGFPCKTYEARQLTQLSVISSPSSAGSLPACLTRSSSNRTSKRRGKGPPANKPKWDRGKRTHGCKKRKGRGSIFKGALSHKNKKTQWEAGDHCETSRLCVHDLSRQYEFMVCVFPLAQGVLLCQFVCISVTLRLYVLHYVWQVAGIEVQYMGRGRKCIFNLTPLLELTVNQCLLLTRVACVSDTMLPTAAVEPSWLFSWDSRFWFEN